MLETSGYPFRTRVHDEDSDRLDRCWRGARRMQWIDRKQRAGPSRPTPAASPVQAATVQVVDNAFSPNAVVVSVGGTVTFHWVGRRAIASLRNRHSRFHPHRGGELSTQGPHRHLLHRPGPTTTTASSTAPRRPTGTRDDDRHRRGPVKILLGGDSACSLRREGPVLRMMYAAPANRRTRLAPWQSSPCRSRSAGWEAGTETGRLARHRDRDRLSAQGGRCHRNSRRSAAPTSRGRKTPISFSRWPVPGSRSAFPARFTAGGELGSADPGRRREGQSVRRLAREEHGARGRATTTDAPRARHFRTGRRTDHL